MHTPRERKREGRCVAVGLIVVVVAWCWLVAIAVYPPPGPRESRRTLLDYILAGLVVLAIAGLVAAVIWLLVSGTNI